MSFSKPMLFGYHEVLMKELIENFRNLEKKYSENTGERGKLLPYYKLLQYLITEYPIESFPNYYLYKQYKTVLSYMHAAVLSRVLLLKDITDYNLVSQLEHYLKTAETNFKNSIDQNDKFYLLGAYFTKQYKKALDSKTNEVYYVIDTLVVPELENINKSINEEIEVAIGKIIENKSSEKLKEDMQKLIVSKLNASSFSYLSSTLSYLGATSEIIKIGLEIEYYDKKSDKYRNLSEDFKRKIVVLQKTGDDLKKVATSETELYSKYANKKDKLKIVQDAYDQVKGQFLQLYDYENQIHEFLKLISDNTIKHFKNISESLDTLATINFKIDQWQLQKSLKDIKFNLNQLIEKQNINEDLIANTEKLVGLTNLVVDLYDHIEHYEESKKFTANVERLYLLPVKLPEGSDLLNLVNDLDEIVTKNMVIYRYKVLRNALKEYVFPFAELYLNDIKEPLEFEQIKNFDALRNITHSEIKHLSFYLDAYRNSNYHVDYGCSGSFTSDDQSSNPFFLWKNHENKDMFTKLLSGQEVFLYADANKSNIHKSFAIKANQMNFVLKAKNVSLKEELNKALNGYSICAYNLGDPEYKFKNKVYVIPMVDMHVCKTFGINENDKTSQSKEKYNNEQKIIPFQPSPYGLWKLNLFNVNGDTSNQHLIKYKDDVNLELEGNANYIKLDNRDYEESKVLKWYDPIDSIDKLNRHNRSITLEKYANNSDTSGLSSSINYLCNVFKNSLFKIKSLLPAKRLKRLHYANENLLYNDDFEKFKSKDINNIADKINHGLSENIAKVESNTRMWISDGTEQNHKLDMVSSNILNNQNLVLLNFAVQKFCKAKHEKNPVIDGMAKSAEDKERAQKLAFSAQIPKTVA